MYIHTAPAISCVLFSLDALDGPRSVVVVGGWIVFITVDLHRQEC